MADVEDKEKAEKLAAAKKRYEQMKKQTKGKKGTGKKKEENTDNSVATEEASTPAIEDKAESIDQTADQATEPASTSDVNATTEENEDVNAEKAPLNRQPSLSIQSKQRSESFRRGSTPGGVKSPGAPPLDSESEVQEVYKKQAFKIEELERENKVLKEAQVEDFGKRNKMEEELEKLREGSSEMSELRTKASLAEERADELENLKSELASTQRQLSQAQQSANKNRRQSVASPSNDLSEQLSSKTSTIESLELELSNLRNQLNLLESDKTGHETTVRDLESRAAAAEASATTATQEVEKLKTTLSEPSTDKTKDTESDPTALQNRISILQSDLRTAQSSAETASNRATSLEQKIEALTKLHRESSSQTTSRDKEIKDLKARIKTLTASKHEAGGEDLSDLEDEEREKLQSRIRELEAENFELRRGAWREKRAALQPAMEGDETAGSPYEDVDLNGATPYARTAAAPGFGRQSSSFGDVLQSGISAFTGRDRGVPAAHARNQSVGLIDEDDFDEGAFARAHEDEAKRRLERVREIKKGLEKWRGWRVDIADMRAGASGGGVPFGPVFEA